MSAALLEEEWIAEDDSVYIRKRGSEGEYVYILKCGALYVGDRDRARFVAQAPAMARELLRLRDLGDLAGEEDYESISAILRAAGVLDDERKAARAKRPKKRGRKRVRKVLRAAGVLDDEANAADLGGDGCALCNSYAETVANFRRFGTRR
ncbi:MAG: hypothetical protein ACYCPT_01910 [Acidimicrobiales bacterium]